MVEIMFENLLEYLLLYQEKLLGKKVRDRKGKENKLRKFIYNPVNILLLILFIGWIILKIVNSIK